MLLLDTWYLTLDIWQRYLTCYYLTPDTWHLLYYTWQLTCYHSLDMLSHGTSTLDLMLWLLTGLLLHLYYNVYSWLQLLRGLGMIIILLQDIWYSWTHMLLNSCASKLIYSWTPVIGRILILFSWCHTSVDPHNLLIMDVGLLYSLWTLSLDNIYNKVLNLH